MRLERFVLATAIVASLVVFSVPQPRASAEVVPQLTYTATSPDISTADPNDVITWTLRQDPTNNFFVVSTDRPIRNRANTGTASTLSETAWVYPFGFGGPGRQVSEPLGGSQIDSRTGESTFVPLGVAGEYYLLRYSVNVDHGFSLDPGQRDFCDGIFCGQPSPPGTREFPAVYFRVRVLDGINANSGNPTLAGAHFEVRNTRPIYFWDRGVQSNGGVGGIARHLFELPRGLNNAFQGTISVDPSEAHGYLMRPYRTASPVPQGKTRYVAGEQIPRSTVMPGTGANLCDITIDVVDRHLLTFNGQVFPVRFCEILVRYWDVDSSLDADAVNAYMASNEPDGKVQIGLGTEASRADVYDNCAIAQITGSRPYRNVKYQWYKVTSSNFEPNSCPTDEPVDGPGFTLENFTQTTGSFQTGTAGEACASLDADRACVNPFALGFAEISLPNSTLPAGNYYVRNWPTFGLYEDHREIWDLNIFPGVVELRGIPQEVQLLAPDATDASGASLSSATWLPFRTFGSRLAAGPGTGAISYSIDSGVNSAGCSIDGVTGFLSSSGTGQCTVRVTVGATGDYAESSDGAVITVTEPLPPSNENAGPVDASAEVSVTNGVWDPSIRWSAPALPAGTTLGNFDIDRRVSVDLDLADGITWEPWVDCGLPSAGVRSFDFTPQARTGNPPSAGAVATDCTVFEGLRTQVRIRAKVNERGDYGPWAEPMEFCLLTSSSHNCEVPKAQLNYIVQEGSFGLDFGAAYLPVPETITYGTEVTAPDSFGNLFNTPAVHRYALFMRPVEPSDVEGTCAPRATDTLVRETYFSASRPPDGTFTLDGGSGTTAITGINTLSDSSSGFAPFFRMSSISAGYNASTGAIDSATGGQSCIIRDGASLQFYVRVTAGSRTVDSDPLDHTFRRVPGTPIVSLATGSGSVIATVKGTDNGIPYLGSQFGENWKIEAAVQRLESGELDWVDVSGGVFQSHPSDLPSRVVDTVTFPDSPGAFDCSIPLSGSTNECLKVKIRLSDLVAATNLQPLSDFDRVQVRVARRSGFNGSYTFSEYSPSQSVEIPIPRVSDIERDLLYESDGVSVTPKAPNLQPPTNPSCGVNWSQCLGTVPLLPYTFRVGIPEGTPFSGLEWKLNDGSVSTVSECFDSANVKYQMTGDRIARYGDYCAPARLTVFSNLFVDNQGALLGELNRFTFSIFSFQGPASEIERGPERTIESRLAAVPTAPVDIAGIVVDACSVRLVWSPPTNRGGEPDDYIISIFDEFVPATRFSQVSMPANPPQPARPTGAPVAVITREQTAGYITGLTPGTPYLFRVVASNKAGSTISADLIGRPSGPGTNDSVHWTGSWLEVTFPPGECASDTPRAIPDEDLNFDAPAGDARYVYADGTTLQTPLVDNGDGSMTAGTIFEGEVFDMDLAGNEDGAAVVDPELNMLLFNAGKEGIATGEGFLPGSVAEVWLFSDQVFLGYADVTNDGTFSKTFIVPADIDLGQHTIQAEGITMQLEDAAIAAAVRVVADQGPGTTLPPGTPDASSPDPVDQDGSQPIDRVSLPATGQSPVALFLGIGLILIGSLLWSINQSHTKRVNGRSQQFRSHRSEWPERRPTVSVEA